MKQHFNYGCSTMRLGKGWISGWVIKHLTKLKMYDTYTFAHALGEVNRSCDEVSKKSTFLRRPFPTLNGAFGELQRADGLEKDYILNKYIVVDAMIKFRLLTHLPMQSARSIGAVIRSPRNPRS